MKADEAPPRRFDGALAVGAGIFLSRIAGLVRERVLAHYLGLSVAADAFRAALRIPNLLQNLLGEGALSASFIPVYARLYADGRTEDASRVARAVGTLLAVVASALALVGVAAARPLVEILAPGFHEDARELTIQLVKILFPGVALLVMSAWCLGVLNSHRRFFLSYVSPVLWNAALIGAAVAAGSRLGGHDDDIAVWIAWGAMVGSAAQFLVQLPAVLRLLRSLRPSLAVRDPGVQATLRSFVAVLLGRGSVQLSGFIDQILASCLGKGIVAAIGSAQIVYLLPVSLFGMAVSAAVLPEMSSATGIEHLRNRLRSSLRRVVFLVVPSAVAFVAIGPSIVALLFQTGRFGADDTQTVWIILAGSAIGLSAGTQGRRLGSAFYALGDPKPPLRAALVRVAFTACSAGRSRCRCATRTATAPRGARSASRRAPGSPRGLSSCCCAVGWRSGLARSRFQFGSGSARWAQRSSPVGSATPRLNSRAHPRDCRRSPRSACSARRISVSWLRRRCAGDRINAIPRSSATAGAKPRGVDRRAPRDPPRHRRQRARPPLAMKACNQVASDAIAKLQRVEWGIRPRHHQASLPSLGRIASGRASEPGPPRAASQSSGLNIARRLLVALSGSLSSPGNTARTPFAT
jgi:putative peptidoglycan lipid II flippase